MDEHEKRISRQDDIIEPLKRILEKAYTEFGLFNSLPNYDGKEKNRQVEWIDIKILVSAINMLSDERLWTDDVLLTINDYTY